MRRTEDRDRSDPLRCGWRGGDVRLDMALNSLSIRRIDLEMCCFGAPQLKFSSQLRVLLSEDNAEEETEDAVGALQ